jgi:hypothetical protein
MQTERRPSARATRDTLINLMQAYKLDPDATAKIHIAVRDPLKANSIPGPPYQHSGQ